MDKATARVLFLILTEHWFDDFETEDGWYDRDNGSFDDRFSTVYGGWRWHFETAEQLKAFCEAVGQA